jgi:hypothetical protein
MFKIYRIYVPTQNEPTVFFNRKRPDFSLRYELKIYTVRSESRCTLRLRYVELVVSIEVAVEVCCCFTVFSC